MNRKQCRTCLRHLDKRKDLISLFEYDQTFPNSKVLYADMLKKISGESEVIAT
jgi:hypothetical protein